MPLNNDFDHRLTRIAMMRPIDLQMEENEEKVQAAIKSQGAYLSEDYKKEYEAGQLNIYVLALEILVGFRYPNDVMFILGQAFDFLRRVALIPVVALLVLAPAFTHAAHWGIDFEALLHDPIPSIAKTFNTTFNHVSGDDQQVGKADRGHAAHVGHHCEHQHAAPWIEFVLEFGWVLIASQGFWLMFSSCERHLSDVLGRTICGYKRLGDMLQGKRWAHRRLLPHVDLHSTQGILMWSELHGLLRSASEVQKTRGEVALGFVVINFVGSILAVIFYLMQEDWKPGLLSAYALLNVFAMLISPLPLLTKGFLLNMSIVRQLRSLTELRLEVSRMVCHRHNRSKPDSSRSPYHGRTPRIQHPRFDEQLKPSQKGSHEHFLKASHAVCNALDQDGRNGFRLLGVPLTLQGLGSIASTVAAVVPFVARKVDIIGILKEHFN